jgi:hypothetical protein
MSTFVARSLTGVRTGKQIRASESVGMRGERKALVGVIMMTVLHVSRGTREVVLVFIAG